MAKEKQDQYTDEGPLHAYATHIPNSIVRGRKSQGLSIYAKWLYVYIKSRAGDNGLCKASTTTIASEAGMSRGQVSAAKKELLKHQLITLKHGENPRRNADHIRIKDIWLTNMQEFSVHNMNTDEDEESLDSVRDHSPGVHTVNTQETQCSYSEQGVHTVNTSVHTVNKEEDPLEEDPKKKKDLPPTPQGRDAEETEQGARVPKQRKNQKQPNTFYTPAFDRMWEALPIGRKIGKVNTFKIWRDLNLEPRADEIIAKIERLKITLWRGKDVKYIPMPETWFGNARYEDELIPLAEYNASVSTQHSALTDKEYRTMQNAHELIEETLHDDPSGQPSLLPRTHCPWRDV